MAAITALLLGVGARKTIIEPTAEAGFERIQALAGRTLDSAEFHAALAELVGAELIQDPVWLADNSLQCRFRLELTPQGFAAARSLPGDA